MKKTLSLLVALLFSSVCSAQYKMDTILYAGDSEIFTDIVFLGDGFTEDEMHVFIDFVNTASRGGSVRRLFRSATRSGSRASG